MKNELIVNDVDLIMNHPHQPRKNYSQENIKRLVASIHKNGLIQPKDDIRQDTLLALTENLYREDLNTIEKAGEEKK